MAALAKSETPGSGYMHSWLLTAADGDGDPGSNVGNADRTVHISGTFNGAAVTLQGSNNQGTSWATLHDTAGNEIIASTDLIAAISENPLHIRPSLSGGDGSTAVNVNLLSRG